ncbi:MAG: hypothetical protein JOZ05_11375, partial [Acetobacteraceae bacterium]|nr:hypothetical protein [Acetobacteraceae bacterium]
MSAVGESRQRSGGAATWRAARHPARLLHWLLRFLLVAALLALAAAGVLAWRLSQGPLDVAWLARRIEAAAFPKDSPSRLRIGQASIAWQGYQEGADHGLDLRLRDLQVVNRSGAPGARLDAADVTLSLGRLLALQVAPRSIILSGLRLRALRAADGAISLDLGTLTDGDSSSTGPAPSMAQTMAELRRPAANDRGRLGAPGLEHLTQLQHVRVHDAEVELVDHEFDATLKAGVADLDLQRQRGGGVRGEAAGQVSLGDATASLTLRADLAAGGG